MIQKILIFLFCLFYDTKLARNDKLVIR